MLLACHRELRHDGLDEVSDVASAVQDALGVGLCFVRLSLRPPQNCSVGLRPATTASDVLETIAGLAPRKKRANTEYTGGPQPRL